MLKAAPHASNADLAAWANVSVTTAARCARALRRRFGIAAKPGPRASTVLPFIDRVPTSVIVWSVEEQREARFVFPDYRLRDFRQLVRTLRALGGRPVSGQWLTGPHARML